MNRCKPFSSPTGKTSGNIYKNKSMTPSVDKQTFRLLTQTPYGGQVFKVSVVSSCNIFIDRVHEIGQSIVCSPLSEPGKNSSSFKKAIERNYIFLKRPCITVSKLNHIIKTFELKK